MKLRHLILIILAGMSLIAAAPVPETGGKADKNGAIASPGQAEETPSARPIESKPDRSQPTSFTGDAAKLTKQ